MGIYGSNQAGVTRLRIVLNASDSDSLLAHVYGTLVFNNIPLLDTILSPLINFQKSYDSFNCKVPTDSILCI